MGLLVQEGRWDPYSQNSVSITEEGLGNKRLTSVRVKKMREESTAGTFWKAKIGTHSK